MNLFFEMHHDLPREAPGDRQSTRRAFATLQNLPPAPLVLDIGCGPGQQTIELAQLMPGKIIAIDTHPPFLTTLQQRALAAGVADRITTRNMSMFELQFEPHTFDVIWSEGAIYIIGFEQGLHNWRPYLKPAGYLAVTEVAWLQEQPPAEIRTFWETEYPAMNSMASHLTAIQRQGYQCIEHFTLPASSWLRTQYAGDSSAEQQLDEAQREIDLFRRYSDWYSYVFYVMQGI